MDSLNPRLGGSSAFNFNSVVTDTVAMPPNTEHLPGLSARAVFYVNSQSVFKEDINIVPTIIDDNLLYVPWSGDIRPLAHRPNGRDKCPSTFSTLNDPKVLKQSSPTSLLRITPPVCGRTSSHATASAPTCSSSENSPIA